VKVQRTKATTPPAQSGLLGSRKAVIDKDLASAPTCKPTSARDALLKS